MTASGLVKKSKIAAAQSLTKASPIAGIQDNALWLESSGESSFKDTETSTGDAVTTWYDQKNSVNKSSVVAVGTGPTYSNTINYIHAIKFSGSTANYLKIADASFLNNTDYTIVIVEKRQSANAGYFLSTTDTSDIVDNKLALGYASDGVIAHSHNSTNYAVTPKVSAYADSDDKARTFVFIQDSTFGKKTYINGTLAAQDASNTSKLSGVTSLAIGKGYTGEIGEIAIFTRALKTEERKFTEDYLGKKWTRKINRDVSPSCINGTVTDSGCASTCTVSVIGVTSPSSVSDGASGNLTCGSPYSGTVAYSCSNGNLNASGSCSQPTCTITSVTGFNDKSGLAYAVSATAISNPCALGYVPSTSPVPSYTCTSTGAATITGTCNASAPTNSVAPALSTTSPTAGVALSVTTGTWTNSPTSYSYQWYWADTSAAISGATSSSYTPVAGDVGHTLRCNVTATNAGGSSSPVSSNTSSAVPVAPCTGGTTITNPSPGVTVHTFNFSGTFECPTARNVEVLVVAGGGAGGASNGGGGGGGGVVYNSSFAVSASAITVTVGSGGIAPAVNSTNFTPAMGGNSVFSTITASGGGAGGNDSTGSSGFNAQAGGSGGGARWNGSGGAGTSGQGNAGGSIPASNNNYACGGGGGAGGAGGTPATNGTVSGAGGPGVSYNISGIIPTPSYGGGGGGCRSWTQAAAGAGGVGGAGANSSNVPTAGTANTGGGGGAGAWTGGSGTAPGANGGSGVVIVKY